MRCIPDKHSIADYRKVYQTTSVRRVDESCYVTRCFVSKTRHPPYHLLAQFLNTGRGVHYVFSGIMRCGSTAYCTRSYCPTSWASRLPNMDSIILPRRYTTTARLRCSLVPTPTDDLPYYLTRADYSFPSYSTLTTIRHSFDLTDCLIRARTRTLHCSSPISTSADPDAAHEFCEVRGLSHHFDTGFFQVHVNCSWCNARGKCRIMTN